MSAGEIIEELLAFHPDYVDQGIEPPDLRTLGPRRAAKEHLEHTGRLWDAPTLNGRRVIVALAMDPALARPLLESGTIASLLAHRRDTRSYHADRERVVWDLLSDLGRQTADEEPLLAAAYGAPPDWSVGIPAAADAIAWGQYGDRLAFHAGDAVYEASPGGSVQQIGVVQGPVVSLGWDTRGPVALRLRDGAAELVRVADGSVEGRCPGVTDGRLSRDGRCAWLQTEKGLVRWKPQGAPSAAVGPPARPLAVDPKGRRALVGWQGDILLLATAPLTTPTTPGEEVPAWSPGIAPVRAAGPAMREPCELLPLAQWTTVASAGAHGGVEVHQLDGTPLARIATAPGRVTALAVEPTSNCLAVAVGREIGVWPLKERPASIAVPGYHSDRIPADSDVLASGDLLDTDRDAHALTTLIASTELIPPLAIGLFGTWGCGKSFLLSRIRSLLEEYTSCHAPGYLQKIRVVRFNAWQYAEVNLWASLVDEVLSEIGSGTPYRLPDQVQRIEDEAADAESTVRDAADELCRAKADLTALRRRLTRRRRIVWALGAVAGLITATVIAVTLLGVTAEIAAGWGLIVAVLGAAAAAVRQVKAAAADAGGLRNAGLTAVGARVSVTDVRHASDTVRAAERAYSTAQSRAARLRAESELLGELSKSPRLGAVLQRMSTLTEYRDQLSLVARTRDRFEALDSAVSAARQAQGHSDNSTEEAPFERIVVMIDELDRCPPDKVVDVLEAVHLLFDFEMFVVLIAVDTRWLDQSLRIRYRQLLGEPGGATPSDYLEKIIQIPLHLRPLDDDLVRGMLAGLTGVSEYVPPVEPAASGRWQPGNSRAAEDRREPENHHEAGGSALRAATPRPPRKPRPAELLRVTPAEASAMSAVAPLIGATPRTVKRYVNTYRLLKTRAADPAGFDDLDHGIGDHEVVALLLALVTGHPAVAGRFLRTLASGTCGGTLEGMLVHTLEALPDSPDLAVSSAAVRGWLAEHRTCAEAPADRYSAWAAEVGRFTFTPPEQ